MYIYSILCIGIKNKIPGFFIIYCLMISARSVLMGSIRNLVPARQSDASVRQQSRIAEWRESKLDKSILLIGEWREVQMIILGVDPGFAITGYGIVEYAGNKFRVLDVGVISTEAGLALSGRLLAISEGLDDLIGRYKPDAMAVEELFFNTNVKTAIKVGHGRGVALLAAAKAGINVYEYTPLQVKQAVVGYGRAKKEQVQQMVKLLLHLEKIPKPDDAADALAIAICHAHSSGSINRLNLKVNAGNP